MQALKAVWAWIVGLFKKPETANTPESQPTVGKPAPEKTQRAPTTGVDDCLADLILNAESYELSQPEFMASYRGHEDDFKAAAGIADWSMIVARYKTATLDSIRGSGTNINLSPSINSKILNAVKAERSRRAKGRAPATNGMGGNGGQLG